MTVKKAVKFAIQGALYYLAALLADLPLWQFLGVITLIIIAEKVGQVE